ncbi:MAG: hypothetical protein C0172_01330 [Caldisphaera sp.]|jgi:hypothetical protein|nr:MAG: hypothetical protein C0172_01330 [Caldisphaera sp.]
MKKKAETIISLLKQKGFKVSSLEEKGTCFNSIIDYNGKTFGLFFYPSKFDNYIVLKITKIIGDCEEILYAANGLFIIDSNEIRIVEKIFEKLNYIVNVNFSFDLS